ncbi:MAG: phosphoadenylyl-sulfate reductase [Anaerolineaceae bacterium]|nr:phosphoadenylyl-sulfate reductase [Anaerolineaceae bacterium]
MNHLTLVENKPRPSWFPANLDPLNSRFENLQATDVLRWGLTTFADDIVLSTGFGPSGIVLMHMVSQIRPKTAVFYLQTNLFFPETLALRDELSERLGLQFTEVHSGLSLNEQAHQFGAALWQRNPDLCCRLRKVEPLRRYLADKKAWITGIRRDQSATRRQTQIVSWDNANHLVKLCPLAGWTKDQVWAYIEQHDLPTNILHDEGYPSIGCMPCTRPVAAGEAERAGRWAGTEKLECGIHIQPDGTIVRMSQLAVNGSR